jgi:hypothetical protein
VANAVAELFGDAAASVGCWTGIYCDDDDAPANQFDAAAEWNRCFKPRVQEGIVARLSGGYSWARLIRRQTPAHRFTSGSLLGACYSFVAVPDNALDVLGAAASAIGGVQPMAGAAPFTPGWNAANPWASQPTGGGVSQDVIATNFANFAAYSSAPLSDEYERIVEDSALASLDEAAQDYSNLQGIFAVRAILQARNAFITMLEQRGSPLAVSVAGHTSAQRNQCVGTLSTPQAHMVDRWVDSGAHTNSTRDTHGFSIATWPQKNPQAWCYETYAPAFNAALQARMTAYQEALQRNCSEARGDAFTLQCPALGSGMQRCRTAFQGIPRGHCNLIPINVRVLPPSQPPPVTEPLPPLTAPPAEPAPPRERTPTAPPGIMVPPPPERAPS